MTTPIDIRADHLRIVQDVLRRHLPDGVKVWVFGSRATWMTKDSSDLDLALEGDGEIPARSLAALESAFEDSDLPYSVDIVDVRRIGERFGRLVETGRLPLPMVAREGTLGSSADHDAEGRPSDGNFGRPSGWRDTTLRDLIEIRHGFAFGGRFIHDEPDGNILLTPGNFAIGGGFKGERFKYYSGPVPGDFVLSKGDLIVTMTDLSKAADTLGYPAFVPPEVDGKCYLHNQRLGRIALRSQQIDTRFLFYLMCSSNYRHEVLASATGTTVKHTSPDRILRFRLQLPPLAEQRAIAHILGALDDKIELNRRMNATLEAMARALYKAWFVDFDPVRAKTEGRDTGMPKEIADLFPDRLVESELGATPVGWSVGTVGDVAEPSGTRVDPTSVDQDTPYIGLEHMHRHSVALTDWGSAGSVFSNKLSFFEGDVLFGKLRPYFHKVGLAPVNGVCSTDIVVLTARMPELSAFVLACTSSPGFVSYANQTSTGTKMPRSWRSMSRYEVCLPPKPIAEVFQCVAGPMLARIVGNIRESRTLGSLRDALLPKLVSGELRVRDAEKLIGAIA